MVAVGNTQGQAGSGRPVLDRWSAELLAAAVAACLYLPSLAYGLVFDDLALIGGDGHPVPLGGALPYRPLRYASYLVDSALGGTPAVYHAHNVVLHALASALVVALARRLGASRPAALAGGLLLACHPLAVEAVAYVSGRRDLLCVALGLAAVRLHLSGRALAALGLVLLSAAAKESGLLFFVPLLAATVCRLGPAPLSTPAGRFPQASWFPGSASPLLAATVAAAAAAFILVLAYGAIGPWMLPASLAGLVLPGRVVLHYMGTLGGLVTPAPEYPRILEFMQRVEAGDVAAATLGAGVTLIVVALAVSSLVGCLRARRSGCGRERAFVLAWTMAVVSALALWAGLHEPGADRHAYLLLAPLGLVLALSLTALQDRARRGIEAVVDRSGRLGLGATMRAGLAFVAVAATLLASASAAREQMTIWKDGRSLWSHAASLEGASPRAHANLARSLARDGRLQAASRHMDTALEADPHDPLLYMGRAAVRCARGLVPLARRDLRRAERVQRRSSGLGPAIDALARQCEETNS